MLGRETGYVVPVQIVGKSGETEVPSIFTKAPVLVGDDYLVVNADWSIKISDIHDPGNPHFTKCSDGTSGSFVELDPSIVPIPGQSRFIRYVDTMTTRTAELYEIVDARANLLDRWQVATKRDVSSGDGVIYSWPPADPAVDSSQPITSVVASTESLVEVRTSSGQLVDSVRLPETYGGAGILRFIGSVVQLFDQKGLTVRYFDLRSQREIQVPKNCLLEPPNTFVDDGKLYFRSSFDFGVDQHVAPFRWLVYDRKSGVVQSTVALDGPFACLRQFTPARHVLVSSACGFSVTEVSADGDHIGTHAPYAWAGWMMPLTALLYIGWALLWVHASIRDGGWAWVDCLLIGLLPTGCMALRFISVEADGLLIFYLTALLVGCLSVAAAWLALGGTRISLRYVPFALMCGILIRVVAKFLEGEPITLLVVGTVLTSGFATVAVGLVLRLFGVRFRSESEPIESSQSKRIAMADFFWATMVFAVLAIAVRPLRELRFLGLGNEWGAAVGIGLVVGCGVTPAVLLALTRKRWLFRCSSAVCSFIALVLVAVPCFLFVSGNNLSFFEPLVSLAAIPLAIVLPFAVTFTLLLPYRLRGCTLGRIGKSEFAA